MTGDVIESVVGRPLGRIRVTDVLDASSHALLIDGEAKRGDLLPTGVRVMPAVTIILNTVSGRGRAQRPPGRCVASVRRRGCGTIRYHFTDGPASRRAISERSRGDRMRYSYRSWGRRHCQ